MIAPELIEQIRESADIVQLIGETVELKRTGADWRGSCPFHGGKHRNFSVVPKKQLYHCFVCHESGDVFTFFMKKFGLDYPAAVREIAGRAGIEVPETRQAGPDPNEPLYSALGVAAEWMARRLHEADDARIAREYLAGRAISETVQADFQLGFAPRGKEMLESLRALGIAPDVLARAGLTMTRDDGSVIPRFRGRLIFPITDVRSRVVGFGGRILGEGEPKYLNSPEGEVYHKGTLLYALDKARGAIRTDGLAIVVEGYVDCIRLHAAGIRNVIAPLGTSLTGEQAKVLRRYSKQVAIAYDADQPGLKSTFRAADELLRQGATVTVVTLPDGEDPDTLVAKGGAAPFKELLAQAVDVLERKIQLLDRKGLFGSLEGRRRALDRLLPTMRAAQDPMTRDLYVARVVEKTGVSAAVLESEIGKGERRSAEAPSAGRGEAPEPRAATAPTADSGDEVVVLRVLLGDPQFAQRAARELTPDQFEHPHCRRMFEILVAGETPPPDLAGVWETLSVPLGPGFNAEIEYAERVDRMRDRMRQRELARIEAELPFADQEEQQRMTLRKTELMASGPSRQRRKALKAERGPKY